MGRARRHPALVRALPTPSSTSTQARPTCSPTQPLPTMTDRQPASFSNAQRSPRPVALTRTGAAQARRTPRAASPSSDLEPPCPRWTSRTYDSLLASRYAFLTAMEPSGPDGEGLEAGRRPWSEAIDNHGGRPVVRALPGMGCVLRPAEPASSATLTSVSAGQP